MEEVFSIAVTIQSLHSNIWRVLADLHLIAEWLGESDMSVKIQINWQLNSPIVIRRFHHENFENKETILEFIEDQSVSYSHLCCMSSQQGAELYYS